MKFKEDLINQLVNDMEGDYEVEEESYWELLDRLKAKNKRSYDFIVKSGDKFKKAILKLVKRVINTEEIPENFLETLLVQLYKGKGSQQEFNQYQYQTQGSSISRTGCRESASLWHEGGHPESRLHLPAWGETGHEDTVPYIHGEKSHCNETIQEGRYIYVNCCRKFFDKESFVDTCVTVTNPPPSKYGHQVSPSLVETE